MDMTILLYLGLTFVVIILLWGIVVYFKRYYAHKKIDAKTVSTWVSLQPEADHAIDVDSEGYDDDESRQGEKPSRAQQNGHYSGSKKIL
jgi:hypothetical protein